MKRRTMFILLLTLFLLFLAAASIFLVSVDPKIKKRNEALTIDGTNRRIFKSNEVLLVQYGCVLLHRYG